MKLYKFYADWCNPCKMLTSTLANVEQPHELVEVDADNSPEMLKQFNVRGLPTLVLVDEEGVEMDRTSGPMTAKQFTEKFVTPYA